MSNNSFDDEQARGDAFADAKDKQALHEQRLERKTRKARGGYYSRVPHRMPVDSTCTICACSPKVIEELQTAVAQGVARRDILRLEQFRLLDLRPYDITRHAYHHGWLWARDQRTEDALGALMQKGRETLAKPETEVSPDLFLKTIQHIDKRSGKIVEVTRQEASVTLNFVVEGVPVPQAARGLATEQAKLGPSTSRIVAPVSVLSMEVPDAVEAVQVAVEPTTDAGGTSD